MFIANFIHVWSFFNPLMGFSFFRFKSGPQFYKEYIKFCKFFDVNTVTMFKKSINLLILGCFPLTLYNEKCNLKYHQRLILLTLIFYFCTSHLEGFVQALWSLKIFNKIAIYARNFSPKNVIRSWLFLIGLKMRGLSSNPLVFEKLYYFNLLKTGI